VSTVPGAAPAVPLDGSADALFAASAGERTVPGIWHENYWFRRHEVVYAWTVTLVERARTRLGRDPVVLDAGCGEGYGTQALAARWPTIALDYDEWTAQHLARAHPSLPGLRGNLTALPLRDAAADVVVSLQTVEHVWDQPRFVAECARVLRPGGLLVLSTPNRLTFPPGNPHHHRELDVDELTELVHPHLDAVAVHGVDHGTRIREWEHTHTDIVAAQIHTTPDAWDEYLGGMVASITTDDFTIGPAAAGCLDLVATGVAR
jgi:SAM-dependent methyltransferase